MNIISLKQQVPIGVHVLVWEVYANPKKGDSMLAANIFWRLSRACKLAQLKNVETP